jgi:ribosomal protein L40E
MTAQWFYLLNGERVGPVSTATLKELAAEGEIQATDMVWREGLPQWVSAGSIKGLINQPTPPPPVPTPRPSVKACPYCHAEVPEAARKCRHCGEIIDVSLRAAEEARRIAERAADHASRSPNVFMNAGGGGGGSSSASSASSSAAAAASGGGYGRKWLSCFGCVGLLVFAVMCAGVISGIFSARTKADAEAEIAKADKLFDQGKKMEAIAIYKEKFSLANDKAALVKRIVEFELERNDIVETRKWIERGFDEKIEVAYSNPALVTLQAQVKSERSERQKKKVEEHVTKEKSANAETDRGNAKASQSNYAKIQIGMTMDEVQAILGPATRSAFAQGMFRLSWPVEEPTPMVITMDFVNDRATAKNIAAASGH